MTRWLRAAQGIPEPLTKPTKPTQPALGPGDTTGAGVLSVKSVLSRGERPDPDEFEERAAIHEFDAGMTRAAAEDAAARAQGFEGAVAYRAALDRWSDFYTGADPGAHHDDAPAYDPTTDPDTLDPDA